ncbi:porin family protein [Spirosoma sp. KNUC1025]|uniref:porin family protein n=1 Tax=Spirosoma sp. KNUC1025 TaxID=2894082 RepID=UPI001E625E0E|nr:porin family protein [Spirosoma sp. KNUC1025]UFH57932.1 porin family protein [Spirosoma sp. KNUC1025]
MATPALAQQPLKYTLWVDGLVNPQLAKSSLYFLGTGLRAEVARPLNGSRNALFVQAGYAHFFQKSTSAFTATIGLVQMGYHYQSQKAFGATVGVGAQYWSERMRVRFTDYSLDETFRNIIPSATVGITFRVRSHYVLGLENRVLIKPESGATTIRNNIAFSVGYTF